MRLFGFEIRRVNDNKDPEKRMMEACDLMNEAWLSAQISGSKMRPWVIWEEQRMVLTRWSGAKEVVYE